MGGAKTVSFVSAAVVVAEPSPPLVTPMGALLVPVVTLAATAVVMVVLPAYLLYMWPSCQEPRCFDYAREMALSLSPVVHPCDDFYGCAGVPPKLCTEARTFRKSNGRRLVTTFPW